MFLFNQRQNNLNPFQIDLTKLIFFLFLCNVEGRPLNYQNKQTKIKMV